MSTDTGKLEPTRETLRQRIERWADDPMSQVVAATGATIGSFGIVLGGIGAIHLAMQ